MALMGVLGIAGFLVVTAFTSAGADREERSRRRTELVQLIRDRRAEVASLDDSLARLREEVATAASGLGIDGDTPEGRSLAALAGTTGLRGPGIIVRLDDAETIADQENAGAFRIHDRDLQLVVNALFASGAEAIAINDSRVVATTPIRNAGEVIVVNFRPQAPPFAVVGIGADGAAFQRTEIARRFRRWHELFGLGFSVTDGDDLEVPAFRGRVGITTAHPAGPDATTTTPVSTEGG